MFKKLFIYILILATIVLAIEKQQRQIHRLIGGHLKIFHEDPHDTELLLTLASGSKDKKSKKDDDDKKTLSQQVSEGKYGLIQKELFSKPLKRPGVISYDINPDVPKDNISNLGGLTKNDIWLAENHLLVIKGGSFPAHDNSNSNGHQLNNNNNNHNNNNNNLQWPTIDDYKAPLRQVKIPINPKIPPPFPVQFTDDGPLQILGTNNTRTINGTFDANTNTILSNNNDYETGGKRQFTSNENQNPSNITAWQNPFPIPSYPSGEYNMGAPFPPFYLLNGTLPPYFNSLPPGAAILPPPPPPPYQNHLPINNQTDLYDEDDPSIYYPPPYSFFYQMDNSSIVPPGPLVPGIILPPPPNFFGRLEDMTTPPSSPTTTVTRRSRPKIEILTRIKNPITTTTPLPQLHPTTIPLRPTIVHRKLPTTTKTSTTTTTITTPKSVKIYPIHYPSEINNELKPIVTTQIPKIVTILPIHHNQQLKNRTIFVQKPSITILKPIKQTSKTSKIIVYNNNNNEISKNNNGKPFGVYGPPVNTKTIVSTTEVPLKIYYSTSNDIETNSITYKPPTSSSEKYLNNRIGKTTIKPHNQYYFYEEPNQDTTQKLIPNNYYVPTKSPKYIYLTSRPYNTQSQPYFQRIQQQRHLPNGHQQQQNYQTPSSQQTLIKSPNTFSIHIARLQKQIQQYYTTPKPLYRQIHSPKPVYQFSFQAANYQQTTNYRQPTIQDDTQDKFRPLPKYSVQIQPAIEILPTPQSPIYQNTPLPQTAQIYYSQQQQKQQQQQQQQQQFKDSTERPVASKYYNTNNPDYEDEIEIKSTPRPILQYSFQATQNPIYQGFYTKPDDEKYFDDNTKNYFTTFGQKLPISTTPIPHKLQQQQQQNQKQQRKPLQYEQISQQTPINLEGDTLVNYLPPRPPININSEYIHNQHQIHYPNRNYQNHHHLRQSQQQRQQQQKLNNNPEIIKAVPVNADQSGSFISYQLPGDEGAHFYFLTPQLAQRRDQGSGYYYSQPTNVARIRRNERNKER